MTLGFAAGPREASCRFCGRSVHPELLSPLEVPYLRQPAFDVCPDCRADYERSGWTLGAFMPAEELPGHYLWPEPSAADLEGAEGAWRVGVQAYLDARSRLARLGAEEATIRARLAAAPPERPLQQLWLRDDELARLAYGLDPQLEPLLEAAWEALDECLPNYGFETAQHARAAVLLAQLTLELGERAPRSYGPRKLGPAAWLKDLRDQARQQPALRDPGVPLLRALLYREEDHLAAVDAELQQAWDWLEAQPDPAAWESLRFTAAYDLHLRARDRQRWPEARRLLQTCCALRPDEPRLFYRLAHAYLAAAQPQVAREVLAAKLGASKVTPAAVEDVVTESLRELRPRLEAWRARFDEPLRVLHGACLLGLKELDEAWRVLEAEDLEAELDEPGASLVERLHLAGRVARERGSLDAALRLLAAALEACAAPEARARVQHDLLCLLAEAARELLEELTQRVRPLRAQPELAEAIRGHVGEADPLAPPGLEQLHALLGRHAGVLLAATSEHERDVFVNFLGRELGEWFRPLVTPPSVADRGDVRVSDARLRIDLTYLALAKRRLPEAFRQDQAARGVAGHATPFHLLLTYLELVRLGGPLIHAWASRAWATLPARRPPLEVGLLIVSEAMLAERDVAFLADLFRDPARGSTAGSPSLRGLRGRCQLIFPRDAAPPTLARDPAVRGFVRALVEACPAFPFVLDMDEARGQFELFFGGLASPDAHLEQAPFLERLDVSVRDPVRRALAAIGALARELKLDPAEACEPILRRYLPEERSALLE